ncbi:MAG: DUF5658 family protein, partial [Peptostreptococcaceae bacterium]
IYSLKLLIFLNLFDGIMTYIGLKMGFYIELNKILRSLYINNQLLFITIKIIIPTIILIILSRSLKPTISNITKSFIIIGNGIYSVIFIYHIILITSIIT